MIESPKRLWLVLSVHLNFDPSGAEFLIGGDVRHAFLSALVFVSERTVTVNY